MLNSFSSLVGSSITATDGAIGFVKAAFFDDQSWAIRYLVVDTGQWLTRHEVLISPYALKQPLGSGKNLDTRLTRDQVKGSPDIDTHQTVSRQHERAYLNYYGYPEYWAGDAIWGMSAYPVLPMNPAPATELAEDRAVRLRDQHNDDVHLRSSVAVTGYHIEATDGNIGHIQDFVFDDESWSIRYLVVDTRNWWPGGTKVLIATQWVEHIDWATRMVRVSITREQVRYSPEYHEASPLARDDEKQLHNAYSRQGYWE